MAEHGACSPWPDPLRAACLLQANANKQPLWEEGGCLDANPPRGTTLLVPTLLFPTEMDTN